MVAMWVAGSAATRVKASVAVTRAAVLAVAMAAAADGNQIENKFHARRDSLESRLFFWLSAETMPLKAVADEHGVGHLHL